MAHSNYLGCSLCDVTHVEIRRQPVAVASLLPPLAPGLGITLGSADLLGNAFTH